VWWLKLVIFSHLKKKIPKLVKFTSQQSLKSTESCFKKKQKQVEWEEDIVMYKVDKKSKHEEKRIQQS
jgi:hypothetical protein